jgi:hypothetical protein
MNQNEKEIKSQNVNDEKLKQSVREDSKKVFM